MSCRSRRPLSADWLELALLPTFVPNLLAALAVSGDIVRVVFELRREELRKVVSERLLDMSGEVLVLFFYRRCLNLGLADPAMASP